MDGISLEDSLAMFGIRDTRSDVKIADEKTMKYTTTTRGGKTNDDSAYMRSLVRIVR